MMPINDIAKRGPIMIDNAATASQCRALVDDAVVREAITLNIVAPLLVEISERDAALEAEASEGERRGLVLVPREPTKAMLHAKPGTSSTHHETYMRALWAAMLDAALIPEAPVREGE